MEQALYKAAILTFEELGFMFPVASPEATEITSEKSINITVNFNGEFSGKIILTVENQVLPELAFNMLGDETEADEEMLLDVVSEVTNVICGNTLPLIAGSEAVFDLDAPAKIEKEDFQDAPKAIAHLDLEEGRADIRLYLDK